MGKDIAGIFSPEERAISISRLIELARTISAKRHGTAPPHLAIASSTRPDRSPLDLHHIGRYSPARTKTLNIFALSSRTFFFSALALRQHQTTSAEKRTNWTTWRAATIATNLTIIWNFSISIRLRSVFLNFQNINATFISCK